MSWAMLEKKFNFAARFLSALAWAAPAFFAFPGASFADEPNYDEAKVPKYELPDVLSLPGGGAPAGTALEWLCGVRPGLREIFEGEIYGRVPPRPDKLDFKLLECGDAFGGKALRKQIRITAADAAGEISFDMLLYIPKDGGDAKKAGSPRVAEGDFFNGKNFPVILGLNFEGNHATCSDANVIVKEFLRSNGKMSADGASKRGKKSRRWPYELAISRGYAVATICYLEIYPDFKGDLAKRASALKIFGEEIAASDCGSIPVWTWGISRAIDCLESLREIDAKKIVLLGHSRLGKTSLFAGAMDERAAIVVTNNSGCMGSALSRRKFGETLDIMCGPVGHWIKKSAHAYRGREEFMPVDQHQLMALVAPRPLYVASASEDLWADPKGELLSLVEASKVYALFGARALPSMENFEIEKPFMGDVGYHLRRGKHDILEYDWSNFMDFADAHFNAAGGGKKN